MTNNMTIGPALAIGGNKVEMTQQGKIQVTNSQGKIQTLSQDEFKKQLIKNAENIEAGKEFEFKKDNKNAKIAAGIGAGLAAAYVGLSVAVGKGKLTKAVAEQGKKLGFADQVKNVFFAIGDSGVKLWNSITGKASKLKDKITGKEKADPKPRTIFNGEKTAIPTNKENLKKEAIETSEETLKLKNETIAEQAKNEAQAFKQRAAEVKANHKNIQNEYNKNFGLKKDQKDEVEVLQRKYMKADGSMMNKAEQEAADKMAKSMEDASKQEFVSLKDVQTLENHGVNVDPKCKEAWEKAHPKITETK